MEDLAKYRVALNSIDEQIIKLLGERYGICRYVAEYKRDNQIPMMQSGRVEEVKNRCAELAINHMVNPDFVRELYTAIIDEACRLEDEIIDAPEVESNKKVLPY